MATRRKLAAAIEESTAGGLDGPASPAMLEMGFVKLLARLEASLQAQSEDRERELLERVCPGSLTPVPARGVVRIDRLRAGPPGAIVPRGIELRAGTWNGTTLDPATETRWRTRYEVALWPVEVAEARYLRDGVPRLGRRLPAAGIRLLLRAECPVSAKALLGLDRLRLHLHGPDKLLFPLYQALFVHRLDVRARPADAAAELGEPLALAPIGLEQDEGWPGFSRTLPPSRVLGDLFLNPEALLFADLVGLAPVAAAIAGAGVEIFISLDRDMPLDDLRPANFLTRATPVINAYSLTLPPQTLDPGRAEHPMGPRPGWGQDHEVLSIDSVIEEDPQSRVPASLRPLGSTRFCFPGDDASPTQWAAVRRRPAEPGAPEPRCLVLCDLGLNTQSNAARRVALKITSSNGVAGGALVAGTEARDGAGTVRARFLEPPRLAIATAADAAPRRLTVRRWLDLHAIRDPDEAAQAIQRRASLEARLDDPAHAQNDTAEIERRREIHCRLAGIVAVEITRDEHDWPGRPRSAAPGTAISLTLDDDAFPGGAPWLYGWVFDTWFGLFADLNRFTRLTVKTTRHGVLKQCPPRWGYPLVS